MRQAVIDGAPDRAKDLAARALAAGIPPLAAINHGFVPGIHHVGEEFGKRTLFLPDLVMAAEAMKAAINVLEPEMARRGSHREVLGVVVLGTVKGDIHEIGKCLVSILLSANGFQVHDLGTGVSPEKFAEKIHEVNAGIVGMSSLLTTTMQGQRTVIEFLHKEGLRPRVKIMVGGAPVTRRWAEEIGADGYGANAMEAVALARRFSDAGVAAVVP